MAKYQFMIGLTKQTMTNVEDLGIIPPKTEFRPALERVNLGSGKVRDLGYSVVIWRWGFLTLEQREKLRDYCSDASNEVWIRTRINEEDKYADAKAIMIWPETEEREVGGIRIDFQLEFRLFEGYEVVQQ